MTSNKEFWSGKNVFLTGHTGFKGSWLAFWLQKLGAKIFGYALDPTAQQLLYDHLELSSSLHDYRGNVTDLRHLSDALIDSKPEILIHMAAQSTVRESYKNPVNTLSTNVMGTVNVLEAARYIESIRVIMIVTSDKCYDNINVSRPHKETDPFGGQDPYSSSKGCAELVTRSFRDSFFQSTSTTSIGIATVRAGNVIGGGDWANNRIVPDAVRAFSMGEPLVVRSPSATRPWQHVLEPLSGYLLLCERLWDDPHRYSSGWNFGPEPQDITTVAALCNFLVEKYGSDSSWTREPTPNEKLYEAEILYLDISKAKNELGWLPRWSLDKAVSKTVEWYKVLNAERNARDLTAQQIDEYVETEVA